MAGKVSVWRDKSGLNNDLTQVTPTNQPTTGANTIGTLNAITFSGFAAPVWFDLPTITATAVSIFVILSQMPTHHRALTMLASGNCLLTLEALPIIEIIPDSTREFFDYKAKYTPGVTQEICPARIDDQLTQLAQSYAKIAHKALYCRGYSRTDMILKDREIYVLETNTIPGMTATSLLPQAAQTAGISFSQLMDKLITLGLEAHQASIHTTAA